MKDLKRLYTTASPNARSPNVNPPICCELLSPQGSLICTIALQGMLLMCSIATFFWMEHEGFFHNHSLLRPVVACLCALYMLCMITSVCGIITRLSMPLSFSAALLQALVVFADIIAFAVVWIMAVGNRNDFLHALPSHLVKEARFERTLGPFWMYLSAITLHIVVAINLCFLQTINMFQKSLFANANRVMPTMIAIPPEPEK